jgi:hypothetical protein
MEIPSGCTEVWQLWGWSCLVRKANCSGEAGLGGRFRCSALRGSGHYGCVKRTNYMRDHETCSSRLTLE